jgi:hypothetical protein
MKRDEKLHLLYGLFILAYLAAMYVLQRYIGAGLTLAVGSVILAGVVELYQHVRKEGVASLRDGAISAAPGAAAGVAWHFWG